MAETKDNINKELSENDRNRLPWDQHGSGNEAKDESGNKRRDIFSSVYGDTTNTTHSSVGSTGPTTNTTTTRQPPK
jgi:hypothetical protein